MNCLKPNELLLIKLGAIAVHTDELISAKGHYLDLETLKALLNDTDIKAWIKAMGPLLPLKR